MFLRTHRRLFITLFGILAVGSALYLPGRELLAKFEASRARRALEALVIATQSTTPIAAEIEAAADAALRAGRRATRLAPAAGANHLLLAEVYARLASLGTKGAIEMALAEMELAAKLEPALFYRDPTTAFRLGVLRYGAKNYAGASESLKQAITLDPNYADAHYFLGLNLRDSGDSAGALREWQIVKRLNPNEPNVDKLIQSLNNG
ncbi:MAG: tetratricopeptide repeat protein [Patescibacteria group bacterium]